MRETEGIRIERPAEGSAVVVFEGEHDVTNRDELADVLLPLVQENRLVVVDLSQAAFVDSSIVYLLLGVQEEASGQDHVLRLQMATAAIVHKVFEVTGALDVLECVSTRAEALTLAN